MGNCDPYSDSPEPLVVNNHSLLGSKEPTLLCNQVKSGQNQLYGNATYRALRQICAPLT